MPFVQAPVSDEHPGSPTCCFEVNPTDWCFFLFSLDIAVRRLKFFFIGSLCFKPIGLGIGEINVKTGWIQHGVQDG